MRVGLNLLFLLPSIVGGTETYAAGLIAGLDQLDDDNEYTVFLNRNSVDWPLPCSPRFKREVVNVDATFRARRCLVEQTRLPLLAKRKSLDLLHSLGYISPIVLHCPSVVNIYDLNYRVVMKPSIKRAALKFLVERSARHAAYVVAPSRYSKRAIVGLKGVSADRVAVVHGAPPLNTQILGDDPGKVFAGLGITGPYICAFAAPSPHKNLETLLTVAATMRAKKQFPGQLVIMGQATGSLRSCAQKLGLEEITVFTGYLDRPIVDTILRAALLFVFPSRHEGFGFPLLEAMAVDCPVVSSNRGSLPEVGGDAAIYFDPTHTRSLEDALRRVANDEGLRSEMKVRGKQNLSRFSWKKSAELCVHLYSLAVHKSRAN